MVKLNFFLKKLLEDVQGDSNKEMKAWRSALV